MTAKLPSLAEFSRQHGLSTKKSLGQHFLFDPYWLERIVAAAGNLDGATVIEVGPGPGGLTRALLESKAARVVAIEKDDRCIKALEELKPYYQERFQLIHGDALELFQNSEVLKLQDSYIIANLPYNIATELLFTWLESITQFKQLILMFQKEVAERICAKPGSKKYGRLSVMTQWQCNAKILFDVPPDAFSPPPKVWSSIVQLIPYPKPLYPTDKTALETVSKAAFGQRRKMLRASLKQISKNPESLLNQAKIDPTLRPEQLDLSQFCALANAFTAMN